MHELVYFIRARKDAIVRHWLQWARQLASAQHLAKPILEDHVPDMLDRLAEALEAGDDSTQPLKGLSNAHALLRLRDGYDIREVVAEYRLLRRTIVDLYMVEGREMSEALRAEFASVALMHDVIDRAITNAADEYAAERQRTREMFMSILSHDLRQPLHTIGFSASAVLDRGEHLDAATVKSAALIAASVKRMDSMISDLLDFARGRLADGLPVQCDTVNVSTLVAGLVDEIAVTHPERMILCTACDPAHDWHAQWDAGRVVQALSNLVGNALAHGHDPIVLEAHHHGNAIDIEVRNHGEIPKDALPRLFEPFYSREAKEHKRQGLGLGLYIVSEIARAHGGTIRAVSAHGATAMHLTLPTRAARRTGS